MASKCVSVVVLGDIGRSPRMQYHALSFAKECYNVDVIGYSGSTPIKELTELNNVKFRHLLECPNFQKYIPIYFSYILKVLWQSVTLFFVLLFKRRSDHIIVQNPPAIPTLAVCWLYSVFMCSNYVIDWHNYGYSIMALTLGKKHFLVRLSYWFEGYFGKRSSSNLCVTKAMKDNLHKMWGIQAVTLYDRPPLSFRPITMRERHNLFVRLAHQYPVFADESSADKTIFTEVDETGVVIAREDRPGLLVSSTSWTEDEDFSILLSALKSYEDVCCSEANVLPQLLCVITGKGPLKEHYCHLVAGLAWQHVVVVMPWLEPDDYPQLLASADLGVSLHTSSSGLDLPMKVVDMFGCGLPVCAHTFASLSELVRHGENGLVFDGAEQLATQLQSWFRFSTPDRQHTRFRKALRDFQRLRWHENWTFNALPQFQS